MTVDTAHPHMVHAGPSDRLTPAAALAALGIVYGDLGTSPL
jgi:K+ transporter